MKALSIRQPYPWLILNKGKDIENRSWDTGYRGWFLIHASICFDSAAYNWFSRRMWMPARRDIRTGGIVGVAYLHSVTEKKESIWFQGKYGFVLTYAKRLPFHRCKGALGFFEPDITAEYGKVIADTISDRWAS